MDERLGLRLSALRRARRKGSTRDGAWAAARLRLPGVVLSANDARFARESLLRFGRALRAARIPAPPSVVIPPSPSLLLPPHRSRRRAVLALILALSTFMLLLIMRPTPVSQQVAGGGDPAVGRSVAQASPLRGRSDQVVALLPLVTVPPAVVPTASGAPIELEERTARPGTGGGGTGGTGGGSGGGSGSGSGQGTGIATPTPDPANIMHLRGRVVYANNVDAGVPGVCIGIGATSCARAPISDANGYWAVDLVLGDILFWDVKFIKTSCTQSDVRVPSKPGVVILDDVSMRCQP